MTSSRNKIRSTKRLVGLCCCLLLLALILLATGVIRSEGLTGLLTGLSLQLLVSWRGRTQCLSTPEGVFSQRYGQCPSTRGKLPFSNDSSSSSRQRPTVYWPSAAERYVAEGYNSSASLYRDFFERGLLRELFPEHKYIHLSVPLKTFREQPIYSPPSVVVCNSFIDTYSIKALLFCNCSTRILVHLSDERIQSAWHGKGSCQSLYGRFDIVLRQYHSERLALQYKAGGTSLLQIPLGVFVRGDFADSAAMSRSAAAIDSRRRPLKWAHVGTIKADRYVAYKTFRSWVPHFYNASLLVQPHDIVRAYQSSLFVLAGRGNANIDVMRVYEAVACGAIPVVVGSSSEVAAAFAFNGSPPPLLVAASWEAALLACSEMGHAEIDRKRVQLSLWYARLWSTLRNRIDRLLLQ